MRKLTTVIMFLAVVGMMAACSGSSSTDDTLTYPGSNVMGTLRFDVDPSAASVQITPVASGYTTNTIPGDGSGTIAGITITSANAVWNGGTTTLDFDVTVKNTDVARELENVRIGVNSSLNMGAKLVNGDRCKDTAWSSCLPGTDPALTYVSDSLAENPETRTICTGAGSCTNDSLMTVIFQGCGAVTAHWTLNAGAASTFTFWATLFGDQFGVADITTDSRYDPYTISTYNRVYKLATNTSSFPGLGTASNSMAKGEWFYVTYGIDFPGNGSAITIADMNDYINNLKHVEDTGNMARYGGDYFYVGGSNPYTIRWDPALIEVNANDGVPPGNNLNKFCTAAVLPYTRLKTVTDPNGTADGFNVEATALPYTMSNSLGAFLETTGNGGWNSTGPLYPPVGNGLDGYDNLEYNLSYITLRVKLAAVSGTGTSIHASWDTGSFFNGYRTMGTPYNGSDDFFEQVPWTFSWGNRCEKLPGNGCTGTYNTERTYVCVL